MQSPAHSPAHLERRIGLRAAVALNMLEMIGVGPFITLPLVLAAAGARLSVWAWLLGAAVAVADGLVWAELGASFPRAGGSYAFLSELYGPQRAGRWLSFLYVWQLSFTAPLSIASGCIGLASFLEVFWPQLHYQPIPTLGWLHVGNVAAALICLAVTALLYRNLRSVTRLAWVLFGGVLITISGVIAAGFTHAAALGWQWPQAPTVSAALAITGLAQATLITTYDYWGYYNICFLGSEVRQPERTIPRAILLSVLLVSALYVLMNVATLPSLRNAASHVADSSLLRVQLVADVASSAWGPWAGWLIAALIVWTAFSSVFSLLLGYSRVPYAAARDGNYFSALAAVHPRHHIPHRSLIALGVVAACFCFFSLQQVITLLVVTRILLQFLLQHVGLLWLRWRHPEQPRPFRMPLYPLPPLFAMAGFVFMLANRTQAAFGLLAAATVALIGSAIYLVRARISHHWPFAPAKEKL